jgi:hypothetical protein
MRRSSGEQARRAGERSKQLAQAALLVAKPNLPLREVQAEPLVGWRHVHAA